MEQQITVSELIELQRLLASSGNKFERFVGSLLAAGILAEHLTELTDRQIGQLMFEHFGNDLGILLPETMICQQAIRRLFRSPGGRFTKADGEDQRQSGVCPKCGSRMLLHYGIDAPDFLECILLKCGYKQPLEDGNADGERRH